MKVKVELNKILKICPGHFQCWLSSNVGKIRKPNSNVPDHFWDEFEGKLKKETKLKWYQRLWFWLKRKIKWIFSKKNLEKENQ